MCSTPKYIIIICPLNKKKVHAIVTPMYVLWIVVNIRTHCPTSLFVARYLLYHLLLG